MWIFSFKLFAVSLGQEELSVPHSHASTRYLYSVYTKTIIFLLKKQFIFQIRSVMQSCKPVPYQFI